MQSFLMTHLLFDKMKPSREDKTRILEYLKMHCKTEENKCFSSIHLFEAFLGRSEDDYSTTHEFCKLCKRLFQPNELQCPLDHTPRYDANGKRSFFVEFNLETELRTRFKDPVFWDAIQYPFTRPEPPQGTIEDVLDGELYPRNTIPGQLHCIGSTDGVKVFKANHSDLWLVMLTILELPPTIR